MQTELRKVVEFLEEQRARQGAHFPAVRYPKVLAFLGTTSLAGSHAALAISPLLRLAPGSAARELRVTVRGPLPRPPARGECVTVHLCNIPQYQGYQVKTRPLAAGEDASQVARAEGEALTVEGASIFTVHHSPYTMKFFEQIPFEEVRDMVSGLRYAIVAVGEQANVSPRFVFHSAVVGGRLTLYHGDGLALKTYMNLKSNRHVTQLVLDLDDFSGWALRGTVEEFQQHEAREAYDRVCEGFAAGNWGKPSRAFRFTAEAWEPIAPTARAAQR